MRLWYVKHVALFDDIDTVLTASVYYARAGSPEMDEREATLKSIQTTLEQWLPEQFLTDQAHDLRKHPAPLFWRLLRL